MEMVEECLQGGGRIAQLPAGGGKTTAYTLIFIIRSLTMADSMCASMYVGNTPELSRYVNKEEPKKEDKLASLFGLSYENGTNLIELGNNTGNYSELIEGIKDESKIMVYDMASITHLRHKAQKMLAEENNGELLETLEMENTRGIDEADLAALSRSSFIAGERVTADLVTVARMEELNSEMKKIGLKDAENDDRLMADEETNAYFNRNEKNGDVSVNESAKTQLINAGYNPYEIQNAVRAMSEIWGKTVGVTKKGFCPGTWSGEASHNSKDNSDEYNIILSLRKNDDIELMKKLGEKGDERSAAEETKYKELSTAFKGDKGTEIEIYNYDKYGNKESTNIELSRGSWQSTISEL
ncbi:MAG: hypothetical protein GY861_02615, partial [bacterium]|nr:hypothetical protein [bacterium]